MLVIPSLSTLGNVFTMQSKLKYVISFKGKLGYCYNKLEGIFHIIFNKVKMRSSISWISYINMISISEFTVHWNTNFNGNKIDQNPW